MVPQGGLCAWLVELSRGECERAFNNAECRKLQYCIIEHYGHEDGKSSIKYLHMKNTFSDR